MRLAKGKGGSLYFSFSKGTKIRGLALYERKEPKIVLSGKMSSGVTEDTGQISSNYKKGERRTAEVPSEPISESCSKRIWERNLSPHVK